jgi:hypothetical protein
MRSWDKPGGDLLTAPAASGVKRARARFRLLHGTGEPVALESPRGKCAGWREFLKRQKPQEAEYRARARGRTVP